MPSGISIYNYGTCSLWFLYERELRHVENQNVDDTIFEKFVRCCWQRFYGANYESIDVGAKRRSNEGSQGPVSNSTGCCKKSILTNKWS